VFALIRVELTLDSIGLVLHPVAVPLQGVVGELPASVRQALGLELLFVAPLGAALFPLHLEAVGVAMSLLVIQPMLLAVSDDLLAFEQGLGLVKLLLLFAAAASLTHRFALLD